VLAHKMVVLYVILSHFKKQDDFYINDIDPDLM